MGAPSMNEPAGRSRTVGAPGSTAKNDSEGTSEYRA